MNLGNGLNIDVGASRASAASISDIVDQMKAILGQIQNSAQAGQSGWKGSAAAAFGNTHTEWQDIATRLNAALREMETNLTAGFNGYGAQDTDAAAAVRSAGSSLSL